MLQVRGEYLPLVELYRVFEVDGAKTDATQGIVVILQSAGRRYALLVDQLIGQHQVVVKNLGKQLPQSAGHLRRDYFGRRQRGLDRRCLGVANLEP